jgi:glycosyltransferase involved in cell wall biosynthesis
MLDVSSFLETLRASASDISVDERQAATNFATRILSSDQEVKNQLVPHLKSLCGHPDSFNGLLLESLLYNLTNDSAHLDNLSSYLPDYAPEFLEAAGTFMAVRSLLFLATPEQRAVLEKYFTREFTKKLFNIKLSFINQKYDQIASNKKPEFQRNNIVVILTPQFLGPPHAPSLDALNFAKTLITEFHKTVVLIETSLFSTTYTGALVPEVAANRNKALDGATEVKYGGVVIPFMSCGEGVLSEQAIVDGIAAVDAISPEMILCVGEPAVLAEPFNERCFCFIYPLGNGLPHIQNTHFQMYSGPSELEKISMEQEGMSDRHLFTHQYDLMVKPKSRSLNREQFAIPSDSFVFSVVGMRLETEVDAALLNMLQKIALNSKAHFMFAGNFDNYETKLAAYEGLKNRTTYIGFHTDIMAVHNITDVFINPARSGGGTGVVYALQAELPVLSLAVGDGGLVTKNFPIITDYIHMADIALDMIINPQLVEEYKEISRNEAPQFSGQLIKRIMGEFEKFAALKRPDDEKSG